MLDCDCPANAAVDTIPYDPCKVIFGKDGRWGFQRLDDANNTFLDASNDISLENSWTALPDETDDSKVGITGRLEDVNFNEPDVLEDSENDDGAPFAVASGPQLVTAILRNPTPDQVTALKQYECEPNLTLYRIDSKGRFMARKLEGTNDHAGILISPGTFIIKDPFRAGTRADLYKLMIQFYLPSGWYNTSDIISPETGFFPLTEIKPS